MVSVLGTRDGSPILSNNLNPLSCTTHCDEQFRANRNNLRLQNANFIY